MTGSYICPNKTSAKKILYSLMSYPYQCDTIKESNDYIVEPATQNKIKEKGSQKSINMPIQLEILNLKDYENKLDKIVKMIQENKKEINKFEIMIQDKLKNDNCYCEEKQENQFYNTLKKWVMKQISICINGFDIQGVLTEISKDCLTLVVLESIYIIPLQRIDFVKLNV